MDAYTIVDLSVGLQKDSWVAYLFVDNVFDDDGLTSITDLSRVTPEGVREFIVRPRTIGVDVRYRFGGN